MQEYSYTKSDIKELYKIRKNYEKYISNKYRKINYQTTLSIINLEITLILCMIFL